MGSFFNKIKFLETVDSTNTFLKKEHFPDKTVVYTFNQTKGRGRHDRVWFDSQNKNLALSVSLKPGVEHKIAGSDSSLFSNPLWFVAACSIALVKLLEELGVEGSWIKWPNDIYIGKAKLSGVLTEIQWTSVSEQKIIVGIGINVNNSLQDLAGINKESTSLFLETGKEQNIRTFAERYITELAVWLKILYEEHNVGKIKDKWLHYCDILNKNVEWIDGTQKIYGKVKKIDDNGYIVLNAEGITYKVISGDITVLS